MEKLVINNDEFFGRVLEHLDRGQSVTIPVKGFSMLPFIRGEKDLVVLERPSRPYRVGDIVLFRYAGRYVMHRILSIDGQSVVIMGDGVLENTEKVTPEDIYGRVTEIQRSGRRKLDPDSRFQTFRSRTWRKLLPVRRYLLYIYRHLPWNWFWLRRQYRQASEEQKNKTK